MMMVLHFLFTIGPFYQSSCVFIMVAPKTMFQPMTCTMSFFACCTPMNFCNQASQPRCYQIKWPMLWETPRQSTVAHFLLVGHQSGFFKAWDKIHRLGEAKNPGPQCNTTYMPDQVYIPAEAINIGVINPTGLINKHEALATLHPGILERC